MRQQPTGAAQNNARLNDQNRYRSARGSLEQKTALYLTEYEGMTQRDLARRLGISVSGAKSRVQRARSRLTRRCSSTAASSSWTRQGKVIN